MSKKASPPVGMRDFLPQASLRRRRLIQAIVDVYEAYGYAPMDTPAMEKLATLRGRGGDENEKLMFLVLKRGRKLEQASRDDLADLGLRFDLTVSFSRFYATNRHALPRVFRRYQIGPVWRADRPQRGRFREFFQCDIDVIGAGSGIAEAEQLVAVGEVFDKLGLDGYEIRLNDRKILPIVFGDIGLDPEQVARAMVSIDKLDKVPVEQVRDEMAEYVQGAARDETFAFVERIAEAPVEAGVFDVEALGEHGRAVADLVEPRLAGLRNIAALTRELTARVPIRFTPSLVRGMAYYTGPIFEVWDPRYPWSLAGGGRYDELIGEVCGESLPACGISIGFERVLTVLEETEGEASTGGSPAAVLLALKSEADVAPALRAAAELRRAGVNVEVFPRPDKLKAQFRHAETLRIPYVLIRHADEGGWELTGTDSHEKRAVSPADLVPAVAQAIASHGD